MSRVVTNLLILNLHLIIDSNKTKSGYSRFKALSMNMLLLIYLESMKKLNMNQGRFLSTGLGNWHKHSLLSFVSCQMTGLNIAVVCTREQWWVVYNNQGGNL